MIHRSTARRVREGDAPSAFRLSLASWGFALSFSKKGSELLLPRLDLLRVGDGDLFDDGCPLWAALRDAHVGFVVVVDGF